MITISRTPGLPKDEPRRAPLSPPSGSRRPSPDIEARPSQVGMAHVQWSFAP